MSKRLFLLDGMALIYRAHFAFIRSPILTTDGVNTSALFGFTNTLLDITGKMEPTHLAVAFDTSAPTPRHVRFPEYKAQREEMPEDIAAAIPQVKRLLAAMHIPVLEKDGFEADDIIGTLSKQADQAGIETFMVTPDKDFAQLVTDRVRMYKPGRSGGDVEILGPAEVRGKWGIDEPLQVIDMLALMGDSVDNIPGIAGIGEKTAAKLIKTFGSVEKLLEQTDQLKGKQKEKVEAGRDDALLSKELATIILDVPISQSLDDLAVQPNDDEALKALLTEFEFNALGRRLFGDDFKAGRSRQRAKEAPQEEITKAAAADPGTPPRTLESTPHDYQLAQSREERQELIAQLKKQSAFCFDLETSSLDPRDTEIVGIAFSWKSGTGWFALFPRNPAEAAPVLEEFRELFAEAGIEKIGHNLKFDLSVLLARGVEVAGPFFDSMLVHSLIAPEQRHGMDFLAESYLNYTPISFDSLVGQSNDLFAPSSIADVAASDPEKVRDYAAEDADVTWQLSEVLRPLLSESNQPTVYSDIEAPLLPVLTRMENAGVQVDVPTLKHLGVELEGKARELEAKIQGYAESPFNLKSPKQLGEVLFGQLKLLEKPKKTATGQYQTNEQVLQSLMGVHPIIEEILEYREVTKLKSTYVDALPEAVSGKTGRIHTTLHQIMTATGRLASSNPNLQNIPIRSSAGREIRKAFVPGEPGWVLLSADYSQIELRVMAALSEDPAMMEAFQNGQDIHLATAAKVYGVDLDAVEPDMRRTAKMVNFGIIYGISAFGLSQRLGIPRTDAAKIIESYFGQFAGVKRYLDQLVADAKAQGYVETLTGRRRYLRDITSANATVRAGAERVAMNTPIQGTAADMIKLAMVRVDKALRQSGLKARMLLQVHDELLFEMPQEEVPAAQELILEGMKNALPLAVPIEVETGTGNNWLEAH